MAAYRIDGGRQYYVEHECDSAESKDPSSRHVINNMVHNIKYMVRMFYIGDLNATLANVNEFAYMTDGVGGGCGPDAYVSCPLCGSEGHISLDKNDMIVLKESYDRVAVAQSPFE